jgi:hypothetical protein
MYKLIGPAFIIVLSGCADGAEPGGPAPATATTGGEAAAPAPDRMGADPAAAPTTGPARLTVQVLIEGEAVDAQVRVLNDAGEVVDEGRPGRAIAVPSGRYAVEADVKDESLLVDTPTRRVAGIFLEPGDEHVEEVEVGRAQVRLRVLQGGREVRNARVELRYSGSEEVVHDYKPGKDHIAISPGRYDAMVHLPKSQVKVEGLIFQPGATQSIPIKVE